MHKSETIVLFLPPDYFIPTFPKLYLLSIENLERLTYTPRKTSLTQFQAKLQVAESPLQNSQVRKRPPRQHRTPALQPVQEGLTAASQRSAEAAFS